MYIVPVIALNGVQSVIRNLIYISILSAFESVIYFEQWFFIRTVKLMTRITIAKMPPPKPGCSVNGCM